MKSRNSAVVIVLATTIAVFLLVMILFRPGGLDLTTPYHSDLYRYYIISESRWLPENWLMPRPLMVVYLKIAGIFHQPGTLFILLALPSIVFVALLAYFVNRNGLSSGILPIVALGFVSFGSPFFYPIFQYDYGGMLGGVFAVIAASYAVKMAASNDNAGLQTGVIALIFVGCSIESKPNYSVLLLAFSVVLAFFYRNARSKFFSLGVFVVLIFVFLKDKFFGSPFVAASGANSPYAVVVNPAVNFALLLRYISSAFTIPLAFSVALASIVLLLNREWKVLAAILLCAVSASVPMSLLANRPWFEYAWYTTAIFGLVVMMATSRLVSFARGGSERKNRMAIIFLVLLFVGVIAHSFVRSPATDWTFSNQKYNRNIISSLHAINQQSNERVLLAGVQGPYHPLKNTAFVKEIFPNLGDGDVLLKKSERAWNDMSHEQTNGVYLGSVNYSGYKRIYAFDEAGRIGGVFSPDEVSMMPIYRQKIMFFCYFYAPLDVLESADSLRIMECLNRNDEYEDSINFGSTVIASGEQQPWIYYHLAKAYQATGNNVLAVAMLQKAVHVEPQNSVFTGMLSSARDKLSKGTDG
jgi:hypothetical protein